MLALIERDPDLYLDEIQDELYSQHGVDVSLATISTRLRDLLNPEELPSDEIVHETVPEGVRIDRTDPDEFGAEYDDDIPEDFPDDLTVSAKGLYCIKKFHGALKAFKREVCPTCSEIDWQM
jgi:hypothetical protein